MKYTLVNSTFLFITECTDVRGDGCLFPFSYNGTEHSNCVYVANEEGGNFMCKTKKTNDSLQECSANCPVECIDELTHTCNDVCISVNTICNGHCGEGMFWCNDKCQASRMKCEGKCSLPLIENCDGSCSIHPDHLICEEKCQSAMQTCNGECLSSFFSFLNCNGTCSKDRQEWFECDGLCQHETKQCNNSCLGSFYKVPNCDGTCSEEQTKQLCGSECIGVDEPCDGICKTGASFSPILLLFYCGQSFWLFFSGIIFYCKICLSIKIVCSKVKTKIEDFANQTQFLGRMSMVIAPNYLLNQTNDLIF